jgi:hypothetical protein
MSAITVNCPYCQQSVTVHQCEDYAPQFHDCPGCKKRFIAERGVNKIKVMKEKDAPCMSNPDCREIETASTCEQ